MKRDRRFREYDALRRRVDQALLQAARGAEPPGMRGAVTHTVRAGGKRVRPVLVLLACRALGGRAARALQASVAVELLHSFTLVHDDIMDHAPTRRGKPAVHALWGVDRGILAGDVILGLAYEALHRTRAADHLTLARLFTRALLDVCEGQAIDLEFQRKEQATMSSYFTMIGKKTGALIRLSTTLGGVIASGSAGQIRSLDRYGHHLGRAFQVRDDLLDVVAEERSFGKKVGGDIREGKKTFLALRAMERATGSDRVRLRRVFSGRRTPDPVRTVTDLYHRLGVIEDAGRRIRRETGLAKDAIRSLPVNRGTEMLRWIAETLEARTF